MPTKQRSKDLAETQPENSLSLDELTAVLVRHFDIHEGFYDLAVQFRVGTGAFGPDQDQLLPGAAITVARVGLNEVPKLGPKSIDAAKINPKSRARAQKKAPAKA